MKLLSKQEALKGYGRGWPNNVFRGDAETIYGLLKLCIQHGVSDHEIQELLGTDVQLYFHKDKEESNG